MKDSIWQAQSGRETDGTTLKPRPLARAVALALVGVAGVAAADHEGLPFEESFDDPHLSDTAVTATTADWGVSSPGQLVLPTAEPLVGPFDPATAGEAVGTVAQTTRDLELADVNGDGWLDLIEGADPRNGIYLNDGAGNFLPRTDLTNDSANTRGLGVGDVDRDGDLDIVAANLNANVRLYLNSGDGVEFTGYDVSPDGERADSVVLEDLNGDGWLDVAIATHQFRESKIYFHTGNPSEPFGPAGVEPAAFEPTGMHSQVVLAGDLDNDGDKDLVLINENEGNVFFSNDGAGNFASPVQIGAEVENSQAGRLGDLNGDGWLDLVVGNYMPGLVSKVYLNSGNPAAPFSETTPATELTAVDDPSYAHHVALADVDLDGDLDILLSTAGLMAAEPNVTRFTNRLYLNDGAGSFDAGMAIGADTDVTNVMAVGDVDRDGRPDIVAGNEDRDAESQALPAMNRLYRNIGMPSGGAPVRQLSAYATSIRVDTETAPIVSVALDASFGASTAHDDAEFWVSSNGGANWLHAEPGGGQVVFPEAVRGTDLRWRVFLRSLSPAAANALALDSVTLASDSPSFTSEPIRTVTAGSEYAYDVTAVDPNGDTLTLTASTLPSWLTFVDNADGTGSLTGIPAATDVGDHEVVLEVADANGMTDEQRFTIVVGATGAPPAFTSSPGTSVTVDAEYRYDITAADPDGDAMTIAASTTTPLPAWLALTDNLDGTATLVGTPSDTDIGDHDIVLEVTDANGMVAQQAFTITVAAAGNAPTFDSAPVTAAAAGTEYAYAVAVSDPEGDALTITAAAVPAWLTLTDNGDGTATLAGTPGAEDVGDHAVELVATDATGASATQVFTIAVAEASTPPDENAAPTFASSAPVEAMEDEEYSYTIEATDADTGDTLTITAPTLPAWLALTDNGDGTATLAGTPAAGDVGDHNVVLNVADAAGAVGEQAFTIAVAEAPASNPNPNPPPPRSSGGGGAAGLLELLGMTLGALLLRLRRRGPRA